MNKIAANNLQRIPHFAGLWIAVSEKFAKCGIRLSRSGSPDCAAGRPKLCKREEVIVRVVFPA
jgi:hypothetical protein